MKKNRIRLSVSATTTHRQQTNNAAAAADGDHGQQQHLIDAVKMRVKDTLLIFNLASSLLSCADAFAASCYRRIAHNLLCTNSRPISAARPSIQSFVLFDHPPNQSISLDDSDSERMLNKITTIVGKSASTLVSASVFFLLAYQRDAVVLTLWIGSILNAILSKVAKKVLNHDRPAQLQNSDSVKLKPSDGGMPSSHAMSLAFIGTSILGSVVPVENRVLVGLVFGTYSAIALRYRVREHLHTVEQVAVGVVLGVMNAFVWLQYGMGRSGDVGPVVSYAREHWVSAETGLFPYSALAIPVVVGIVVVGSFERRIALWIEERKLKD